MIVDTLRRGAVWGATGLVPSVKARTIPGGSLRGGFSPSHAAQHAAHAAHHAAHAAQHAAHHAAQHAKQALKRTLGEQMIVSDVFWILNFAGPRPQFHGSCFIDVLL